MSYIGLAAPCARADAAEIGITLRMTAAEVRARLVMLEPYGTSPAGRIPTRARRRRGGSTS